MALQINKTLDKGIVATECYAKITGVDYVKISDLDEEFTGIRVVVSFYYNKAARDANSKEYLSQESFDIADATTETRAAQYAYLKTLDDFSGSTDV